MYHKVNKIPTIVSDSAPNESLLNPYSTMDDRDSIYLDTISMTSEYPNRKSMSLSRQTIYHSAEDLTSGLFNGGDGDCGNNDKNNGGYSNSSSSSKNNNNNNGNNGGTLPRQFSPTKLFKQQQRPVSMAGYRSQIHMLTGTGPAGDNVNLVNSTGIDFMDTGKHVGINDEVSARLLSSNNKTVTYSQWKSRTWRRFQDGERSVDYILAYPADDPHPRNADKRQAFEYNLENEGLQLEREQTQRIHFVKIHAPQEVLCRYCEILKMKMPIKKIKEQEGINVPEFQLMQTMKTFFGRPFDFVDLDKNLFPDMEYKLQHEFTRNHSYLFDEEKPGFFPHAISIAVVHFILERQRFSDDDETSNNVGIEKLLTEGVYEAAYPLHDGDCNIPGSERNLLYSEWAAVNKWIKHQPLENIKEYFGVKVAMYFAWLGFYTHMLISASIIGIICFLYGLFTLFTNTISEDVCNSGKSIIMCPQCDEKCDYWYLSDTCVYSRISYLFDNNLTVVFAVFMSFWAVLYLELWKRYSAKLIHQWGMSDYSHQAEHPRPQYLARLKSAEKKTFNVIHRVLEPHVPFWKIKFPIYVFSFSIVFLFISLAVAAVFGITIYRMSLIYSRTLYGTTPSMTYTAMVLPATAAVLNLIVITILNYAYDYLAVYLTNMEYRRTQTEYDESLTLKIYLFQFVNYYSSIFYIAFLKGKFVGYPAKYNRIFGLRQEECSPGGCLMELCIQLVIIMVGKQAMNSLLEMLIPFLIKRINSLRSKWSNKKNSINEGNAATLISCNQWTNDYKLLAWSQRGLFDEYLEMIIQYGFVTIFVVAFPLAPLFALLNNIFEMRLDAKKFLKYYRRPVPSRVKDIGVWYNIMAILGRIAVISSAFIIAFSSNFIPRLVYTMTVNKSHTAFGFLNFTLATFDPMDFQNGTAPINSKFNNVTVCHYQEYRNPHDSEQPYKRPLIYWHILAARLAFLVVFQNINGLVQMVVAWAIPDVPRKLSDRIKREDYLTREIIIEHEKRRAQIGGVTNITELPIDLQNTIFLDAESGYTTAAGGSGVPENNNQDINDYPPPIMRRRKENGDLILEDAV